jgi:CRP-like cAMP-binding protein
MSDPQNSDWLAQHAFVRDMPAAHLATLRTHAQRASFAAHQYLGREGQPADRFYLIHSGHVALEARTPHRDGVRIETVGAGDPVGWSWLLPPHRWQFDARAVEAVEAIAIDAQSLREQCERDHEFGFQVLRRLLAVVAKRLAAARLQLLDIYQ